MDANLVRVGINNTDREENYLTYYLWTPSCLLGRHSFSLKDILYLRKIHLQYMTNFNIKFILFCILVKQHHPPSRGLLYKWGCIILLCDHPLLLYTNNMSIYSLVVHLALRRYFYLPFIGRDKSWTRQGIFSSQSSILVLIFVIPRLRPEI